MDLPKFVTFWDSVNQSIKSEKEWKKEFEELLILVTVNRFGSSVLKLTCKLTEIKTQN